ncbi:ribose-phosphate pyrophosphokinase [Candidatus Micrarchaeota archaeon]|nr:ribose-phosphate pyrophosphokinase [Candidatus Micrarchaeota archaeon]
MLVVGCSKSRKLALKLSKELKASYSDLFVDEFPDGELRIRFQTALKGKTVLLVQSMHPSPNDSLMELLLALRTAKELNAKKIIAVVPYLAYARQDVRFNPGECVSNKIIARMIEDAGANAFVTVNTHLHRISSLKEIFKIPSVDILLNDYFADYYAAKKYANILVVGPDIESTPWIKHIAKKLKADYYVFNKKRFTGTKIENIILPGLNAEGKNVLLIDDVASTGNTLISVSKILKKYGAKRVDCVVTHLLDESGGKKILNGGISSIACADTLENKYVRIDCSKAIALAVRKLV